MERVCGPERERRLQLKINALNRLIVEQAEALRLWKELYQDDKTIRTRRAEVLYNLTKKVLS